MGRSRALAILPPLLIVGLLLAAWQLYANLSGIGNDVLPRAEPRALGRLGQPRRPLGQHAADAARDAARLRALARGRASTLAVLVDTSAALRRALMPVLVSTQTLPIVAIAPLMVIWFGFGLTPKVLLVALVTFFPITVAFAEGFASSDPEAEALLRSMGASRLAHLPLGAASRPRCRSSSPACASRSPTRWSAAIFAEYAGASEGLGIYMQNAEELVPHRPRARRRARQRPADARRCSRSPTCVERVAIPWYRLSRQGGRRG